MTDDIIDILEMPEQAVVSRTQSAYAEICLREVCL